MQQILYCILFSIALINALPRYDEKTLLEQCSVTCDKNPLWTHQLNNYGIYAHASKNNNTALYQQSLLHKDYPALNDKLAYLSFAQLPTPVERLAIDGISQELYIKRDDLTGCFSEGYYYGGNKVRKLEFLLADALTYGATEVITFGCTGSNHALATSVYASALGLQPTIFVMPQKNSYVVQQNLLMHTLCGTDIHFYHTSPMLRIGTLTHWYDTYKKTGKFAYVIPTGGSNALGALGFVNAALELKSQINAGLLSEPDYIYCASGSFGTAAGLLLGLSLTGLNSKLVGVMIEKGNAQEVKEAVINLAGQSLELLQSIDSSINASINGDNLIIKDDYIGQGYGVFSKEGNDAQAVLYDQAHIALEGTYTDKAFAALIHDCLSLNIPHDAKVLFWNTYCGLDFESLTDKTSFESLPLGVQYFFTTPPQEMNAQA